MTPEHARLIDRYEALFVEKTKLRVEVDSLIPERERLRSKCNDLVDKRDELLLQKRELEEAVLNLSLKYQQHNFPLPPAMIDAWAAINQVLKKNPPGYVRDIISAVVPYTEDLGRHKEMLLRIASEDCRWAGAIREFLEEPSCEHEWVDARNEIVKSGELCLKCHAIRAGNVVTEKRFCDVEIYHPDGACGKPLPCPDHQKRKCDRKHPGVAKTNPIYCALELGHSGEHKDSVGIHWT